ncbi:MAG TPA: tetratricopeptide repeat protein [Acidobacteriaceae bacterium]|nr:tetratricopeptide repeat protein [Acidobacteriaceae bacterium]
MRENILKHAVSLVLLSSIATGLWAQSGSTSQLNEVFHHGAEAMAAGHVVEAEAAFKQATVIAPAFAPAFLDLGLTQLRQGKLEDASASIKKALELDPNSHGAHLFLGIADYQSHHIQEAVDNLRTAIQEEPKNVQALLWLGIVEMNAGHPEKATEPLDQAAALDPKNQDVLDYRVQAHLAVAKQSYAALYHLAPTSWRLHRLNAVIDAQANDHKQAADEYEKAIKMAPNQPELYEGLGWQYQALGEIPQAQQSFAEQLKLTPGNPIAMYNLACAEVENEQSKPALPLLETVVKIYKSPTDADYYLGRALAMEGRNEEAVKEFQRATQVPGLTKQRAWYQLAQLYRHMGKTAEAHAAIMKYQVLRQRADRENAKQVEDWRKLNAADAAVSGGGGQH